jgi:hypothetical protein
MLGTALPEPAALAAQQIDPRAAAREVIRSRSLQADMPHPQAEPPRASWFNPHLSPEAAKILLWTLVIAGVLIIAWSIRDKLPMFDRSRRLAPPDDHAAAAPQALRLEKAQAEADVLAENGRYVEAMHVLLLRSVAEMRKRLGLSFADSLTSREILHRAPLSEHGRDALGAIIFAVEGSYFGKRGASNDDYLACRKSYDALRQSLIMDTAA